MASYGHLAKTAVLAREDAMQRIQALLPEHEQQAQEALYAAQNDKVGRTMAEFGINAVASALAAICEDQQHQIDELKEQVSKLSQSKRSSSSKKGA